MLQSPRGGLEAAGDGSKPLAAFAAGYLQQKIIDGASRVKTLDTPVPRYQNNIHHTSKLITTPFSNPEPVLHVRAFSDTSTATNYGGEDRACCAARRRHRLRQSRTFSFASPMSLFGDVNTRKSAKYSVLRLPAPIFLSHIHVFVWADFFTVLTTTNSANV